MTDREKILERLRKKEQEIEGLEERLRAARTYAQALQDVLKLLGGNEEEAGPSKRADSGSETNLRQGSSVDLARAAIKKHGAPLHINDLAEALGKDASREARISLASSLAAYVRKREIFTRTAPNTFGLAELGHESISDEVEMLPAGFGQVRTTPKAPLPPPASRPAPTSKPAFADNVKEDIPF